MNLKEWYNAQPIKRRGQVILAAAFVFIAFFALLLRLTFLTGDKISQILGL